MAERTEMDGKRILITGGTGTVGSALVERLVTEYPALDCVIVLSNNEQEQFEMAGRLPASKYPLRYLMADVRDRERMLVALRGVDIVIHAAAMKHVPVSESNPIECAQTNILGSQNVIDAALANGVQRVVALSTDKAVAPINVYGASKMFLERLFLNADGVGNTRFSVVRYANVFGSKGSVVPFFMQHKAKGFLPITHPGMTRFSITMSEALDLILHAVRNAWGGEVIVPRAPSYRIMDVAEAIAPGVECRIVGKRPGEKLHECMLGADEASRTVRLGERYIICPDQGRWHVRRYCEETGAVRVNDSFDYDSGRNDEWLNVEQIRKMVLQMNHIERLA
jgi:UDP-N-acetylglucosamine 4,6-dehydratase